MPAARLPLAALCAAAAVHCAHAAERQGRFTLDLRIDGPGLSRAGPDHATYATSQSLHMAFTLMAPAEGDSINQFDDTAAAQQGDAAHRMPPLARQQEFARRMHAEAQACAGDVACLQQVAMKRARERQAWLPAGADRSADDGRYFNYGPGPACKGEFAARIRDSVEGVFPHMGGMRPFAGRTTANVKGDALQLSTVCTGAVTVDSRTGKLYARLALPRIDGQVVNTEAGRVVYEAQKAEVLINQEAWKWAVTQLQGAARSGIQRAVLRAPVSSTMGGNGEHELSVEVRWAFKD